MSTFNGAFPHLHLSVRGNPARVEIDFVDYHTFVFRIFVVLSPVGKPFQVQIHDIPYARNLLAHVLERNDFKIEWDVDSRTARVATLEHLKILVMQAAFQFDKARMQPNWRHNHAVLYYHTQFSRYMVFVGGDGQIGFPRVRHDIIEIDRLHSATRCLSTGPWTAEHENAVFPFRDRYLNFIPPLRPNNINADMVRKINHMFRSSGPTDSVTVQFGKFLVSDVTGRSDGNSINLDSTDYTSQIVSQWSLHGNERQLQTNFAPCLPSSNYDVLADRLSNDQSCRLTENRTDVVSSLYFPRIFQPDTVFPNQEQQHGRVKLKIRGFGEDNGSVECYRDVQRKTTIVYASGSSDSWDFKINHTAQNKEYAPQNENETNLIDQVTQYFEESDQLNQVSQRIDENNEIWGHVGRIDVYRNTIFECQNRGIKIDVAMKYCKRIFEGPKMCSVRISVLENEEMTAQRLIENIIWLMGMLD
ncbi:hypothetical protein BKA69DRAFT_1178806 [Paraphysoderma sedebokerense]|nr:hypothetical protein BKA69DRAFT_1178806 [Paraphysoderma sedebokerense]